MNKASSAVAFLFFAMAWGYDLATDLDITGLMNVGLMWLSLAAIIGRKP